MRHLKAFLLTSASFAAFLCIPYWAGVAIFNLFIHTWPSTIDISAPIAVLLWSIGFIAIVVTLMIVRLFVAIMGSWYIELGD